MRMKFIALAVLALFIISSFSLYLIERERRQMAESARDKVTEQRDSLIELKDQQLAKIKSFNELSVKYAEEAANAQKEIDSLRSDIRNGTKRMYIKTRCPEPMPKTDPTRGVGDESTAEVERAIAEDILDLREMNAKAIRQVLYLQDYIHSQCQLPNPTN